MSQAFRIMTQTNRKKGISPIFFVCVYIDHEYAQLVRLNYLTKCITSGDELNTYYIGILICDFQGRPL